MKMIEIYYRSTSKCKVLHFGKNNPKYSYTMGGFAPGGTVLESTKEEKDIGVIISDSLKNNIRKNSFL